LGLGSDVIDDAWQLFEILRLATELMRDDQFRQDVETCAAADRRCSATAGTDPTAAATAEGTKNYALAGIAARCHPDGLHLLAVEQVYSAGTGFRWGSPIAERLAAEINRAANLQPLVDGLNGRAGNVGAVVRSEWIELALKAVSQAVGRVAERHPANWPPGGGVLPNEIWLDD
jgi:hypothetical protein